MLPSALPWKGCQASLAHSSCQQSAAVQGVSFGVRQKLVLNAQSSGVSSPESTAVQRLHFTFSNITFIYAYIALDRFSVCFVTMPSKQIGGWRCESSHPKSLPRAGLLVKAHHLLHDTSFVNGESRASLGWGDLPATATAT